MKKYILDTLTEKIDIMKRSRSLLKRIFTIIVIIMMSFFVLTTSYVTITGESKTTVPTWKNGDDWFYKLDRAEGTATFEAIVSSENANFKIDETTYKCYMVERTWNLPNQTELVKKFFRQEDLAHVGEVDSSGKRIYFGEPLQRFDFPLKPGKQWVGNTLRYTQGQHDQTGEVQSKVNYTYEVMEKTEITVKAGTFETYKINGTIINTDPSNSQGGKKPYQGYVHFYYSPEVKNYVKIINYYGSEEMGTQELYSYNVTDVNSNDSPSIGSLTLGITTVSMVALYKIIKRKRDDY